MFRNGGSNPQIHRQLVVTVPSQAASLATGATVEEVRLHLTSQYLVQIALP